MFVMIENDRFIVISRECSGNAQIYSEKKILVIDDVPRVCAFFCCVNLPKGQIRPAGTSFLTAEGQLKMGVERNDD